jgi:hypothetical protein
LRRLINQTCSKGCKSLRLFATLGAKAQNASSHSGPRPSNQIIFAKTFGLVGTITWSTTKDDELALWASTYYFLALSNVNYLKLQSFSKCGQTSFSFSPPTVLRDSTSHSHSRYLDKKDRGRCLDLRNARPLHGQ